MVSLNKLNLGWHEIRNYLNSILTKEYLESTIGNNSISIRNLSRKLKCSSKAIAKRCKLFNIEIPRSKKYNNIVTKNILSNLVYNKNMDKLKISEELNVPIDIISSYRRKFKIEDKNYNSLKDKITNLKSKNNSNIEKTYLDIFNSYCVKNENCCWEWNGTCYKNGYGCFSIKGKRYLAHRLSYVLYKDEIEDDLCVLHKCDNRKCVNPEHLFLGTHRDNSIDMHNKNRGVSIRGENNSQSKLKTCEVLQIRKDYQENKTKYSELSKKYNVSVTVIKNIIKRIKWKHV